MTTRAFPEAGRTISPRPPCGPGTARRLRRGFEERELVARWLFAVPPVLRPEHVHRPADRNVAESLKTALFPPGCYDPAAWAPWRLVSFDNDLPAADRDGDGNDVVVGQVEDDGGSAGCELDSH